MTRAFLIFIMLFTFDFYALATSVPEEPLNSATFTEQEIVEHSYRENTAYDAHYNEISTERLSQILHDPQNRVTETFKIPDDIMPEVGFWFRIYTKFSLYQVLIYDKEHPDKIYAVVDARDLFKKGKSPVAIEIMFKQRVNKALAAYRQAFTKLAHSPYQKFSPEKYPEISRIKSLWGNLSTSKWHELSANLRTQTGQRDRIMNGILSAEAYIPAMEAIFRKFDLPTELVRIPLVESSFILTATSKADAVGAWQFLERSALEYLVVDKKNKIDERLSPIKSSYAAARMFKRNYKILGDYALAVIAYNHGAKNLINIRHKFKGDNISKLLKMKKNSPLGYASRNYYIEFLALLHAEKYRDEIYGIPVNLNSSEAQISIVKINVPASIFDIAAKYKISLFELKKFNPDIFDPKIRLPRGTRVVIPRKVEGSLVMIDAQPTPAQSTRAPAEQNTDFEVVDYLK